MSMKNMRNMRSVKNVENVVIVIHAIALDPDADADTRIHLSLRKCAASKGRHLRHAASKPYKPKPLD